MKNQNKLNVGEVLEVAFQANHKKDSAFCWKATKIEGQKAPKVILSNDSQIQAGELCKVRITSIKKPKSHDRGHIEVVFLSRISFTFDDDIYLDPVLKLKLQALLELGFNILLDGPQGSGKTVLSRQIAKAMKLEYIFFNCSAIYEATDYLATIQIQATESGQAVTKWVKTDILRALEEAQSNPTKKFLIFLDEFNRCREMARNGIMPALDSTRKLYNPLTGSTIDIPPNTLWIAAINNGAQFTGTTSVDPAQLDRFAPLKMDYLPEADEVRILQARFPLLKSHLIMDTVKAANAIRQDENLGLDLSMRATEEACSLLTHPNFTEDGKSFLPELLKTSFCGRFGGSWNDEATDAGLVWNVIVRTLAL